MKFKDFYASLEALAPREGSAAWDNDGVMVKLPDKNEVERVLIALDPTEKAIKYAAQGGFDVLLTHHPLIFKGLKSLSGEDTVSSRVLSALGAGVTVVSLHTRLDSARGGVNDALLDAAGATVCGVFGDADDPEIGRLGEYSSPMDVTVLAERIKEATGAPFVRVYGTGEVKKAAFLGGSGKDFVVPAMAAGADVLVTGEVGYNAAEAAAEAGLCIIEAGHYHTEAPVCSVLKDHVDSLGLYAEIYEYCPYTAK